MDEIFNRATSKESASKVTYMISDKDISVVVQGPIHTQDNLTKRVLESVRTHLPDAELILSTWKGSDVDGLDYDVLVENEDPGKINNLLSGSENFLRQVTFTFSGLQKSSGKYVLKSRTDIFLSSSSLLENVSSYTNQKSKNFFNWYIFTIPKFFRDPRGFYKRLYHPSDIVQFGLRTDLLSLWELDAHIDKPIFLTAEQYIWLQFLKKRISINYDANKSKWRLFSDIILSEKTLIEHFVILDEESFGVTLPKKFEDINRAPDEVYTEKKLKQLRIDYESHPILTSYSLIAEVYFNALVKKLRSHLRNLITK